MPNVAFIGSVFKAVCCCHDGCIDVTGVIVSGSPTVFACNPSVARIGDIGIASCGHIAVIVTGSATVFTNSISTARIGDVVSGCPVGTIVTGAPTVFAT